MRISSLATCLAGMALASVPLHAQGSSLPEQTSTPAIEPAAVSQVRIVRLSEVRGEAELARHDGRWEHAFANIPLVAGDRLRTLSGLAEVEFEDNSTLRLTPGSAVEFTELGRSARGATITRCNVLHGTVFVSLARNKAEFFTVVSGKAAIGLNPGSHIRLDAGDPTSGLAVLQGTVEFHAPSGSTTVPQKNTLRFNVADAAPATLVARVEKTPFDGWDKDETTYQAHNAAFAGSGVGGSGAGGSGFLYGSGDLNYYGSFADLGGGCGSLWHPYFASAAWDPYSAGFAAWYPGGGYSWVSPYPWGWLPFHTGVWQNCGAGGWGWNPTGAGWRGLNNWPIQRKPGQTPSPQPPKPPSAGGPSLLAVNATQVPYSRLTAPGTFTFRNDSAGLGVPREVFGKLGKTSAGVARHGFADAEVGIAYISAVPLAQGTGGGREAWGGGHPVAILTRASGFNGGAVQAAAHDGLSPSAASFASGRLSAGSAAGSSSQSHSAGAGISSGSGPSSSGGGAHK